MAEPNVPILDLLTVRTRPMVAINGRTYDLRTSNDLTIQAYRFLERVSPRVGVLVEQEETTAAEDQELSDLLDDVCRRVLVAPDDVHDAIGDLNRLKIFTVFTELLTPSLLRLRAVEPEALAAIGTTSSRGSRGSTAARRSSGSRKSRSGSSARTS